MQRESFRKPGNYEVTITLRRTGRIVARAVTRIEVKGDVTQDGPWAASLR